MLHNYYVIGMIIIVIIITCFFLVVLRGKIAESVEVVCEDWKLFFMNDGDENTRRYFFPSRSLAISGGCSDLLWSLFPRVCRARSLLIVKVKDGFHSLRGSEAESVNLSSECWKSSLCGEDHWSIPKPFCLYLPFSSRCWTLLSFVMLLFALMIHL